MATQLPINTMNEPNTEDSTPAPLPGTGAPSEMTKHLAYAGAAFMLVECLMLAFIERGLFTIEDMVSQVETAIATQQQTVNDGQHAEISAVASRLLTSIANSLAAATEPRP
jgi:hypothetical protein